MKFDGIEKPVTPPHCEQPSEQHVLIYQHCSGGNRVQAQWAPVSLEAARWFRTQPDLLLECEILTTGEIALYCHYQDEENYGCDIAQNGPGDRSPGNVLDRMILKKKKGTAK